MYHEAHIAKLSPKQISRLLNAHPVRIKHGSHHKIHLSPEHHKKLHRAGLKGTAITVQLDPFAIAHNEHLRDDVKGLVKGLGMHHAKKHHMHGCGGRVSQEYPAQQFYRPVSPTGSGMKRGRPRKLHGKGTGTDLGAYIVTQGIEPLITASAQRGVQAVAGSGVRRGRPRKHLHGGYVSASQQAQMTPYMTPGSHPTSSSGPAGSGLHRKHLHGKGTGTDLGNYIVTQGIEPLITASAQRGVQAVAGSGLKRGRPRKHHKLHEHREHREHGEHHKLHEHREHGEHREHREHGGKVSYQQGLQNFRDTTKAVGQVFLPLNRGVMGAAKRQIITAASNKASNSINPNAYNPMGMTSGQQKQMNRSSRPPTPVYHLPQPQQPQYPVIAMPLDTYSSSYDLPYPPNYSIPQGKMYASGLKKDRPKRVMTERQKEALAKGRHNLRIKLNEMGAGMHHKHHLHGKALAPAGYTFM